MRPTLSIVESAVDIRALERRVQTANIALQDIDKRVEKVGKQFEAVQEERRKARLVLGRELIEARKQWPARGPRAKGWGDFLAAQGIDQDVALGHMKYAGFVEEAFPGAPEDVPGNLPNGREAGIDKRPRKSEQDDDNAEPSALATLIKAVGSVVRKWPGDQMEIVRALRRYADELERQSL